MNVRVGYYAILREQAGLSEECLDTAAATAQALYAQISGRHQFTLRQDQLRVVINDAFRAWDSPLAENDHVVFIPPVAGG